MKRLLYALARPAFARARRRTIVPERVRSVLVIKLCCIGDVLFTSPMLRALHAQLPQARITYLVSDWCRELVTALPGVTDAIGLDPYSAPHLFEKVRRTFRAVREIRSRRFDAALILHRSGLAAFLPALSGVPVRIGFDWEGQGFSLTHPLPFRSGAHEVDRYLDCLRPLGVAPGTTDLEMNVPASAQDRADRFLAERADLHAGMPLVAVFPGGGVNPGTVMLTKRWTVAGYQEICRRLDRQYGARLLFVGSAGDAEVNDTVLMGAALTAPVVRAEGRTGLLQTAALLKRCDLFIGGDSGPLYLAAAVGTPTVSIFGPSDPALVAPRGARHRTIRRRLDCSPCYTPETVLRGSASTCRLGRPICMEEVPTAEVGQAVEELLREKGFTPR